MLGSEFGSVLKPSLGKLTLLWNKVEIDSFTCLINLKHQILIFNNSWHNKYSFELLFIDIYDETFKKGQIFL